MQLSALKATTVWHLSVCFTEYNYTNIFVEKKSVLGYEYVNEKARKEWWRYMKWRPPVEFRILV